MGKKIVIKKHHNKNGKAIFLAGSGFLMACLVFVWIVQFQTAFKRGILGDFETEWAKLSADLSDARHLSEEIEQSAPLDVLELNLLPRFALTDRETQQELATSIEEEMTKRRFGTLPMSGDRVTKTEATEDLQPIEVN